MRIIQFIPLCIIFTCSAAPPSLVDLSIKKICELVSFKDIDKLPLTLPEIEQLELDSFMKHFTHLDYFSAYFDEMHDHLFHRKAEPVYYEDKLVNAKYTELPEYPRNNNMVLDDHGHFFTFFNWMFAVGDCFDDDWDYQAHSIFFALVRNTEEEPSEYLFIHRRDNTIFEDCRKPITKLQIYPLDTFKRKTWSDYTFGSDIVKEDNYVHLHVEPLPPTPEAYKFVMGERFDADVEVFDVLEALARRRGIVRPQDQVERERAEVEKKQKIVEEKERAQDAFYKEAILDRKKKYKENYRAAEAALGNACTMSKLTIYKIIKGLPIPRSHLDEICYTGTMPLNIQD